MSEENTMEISVRVDGLAGVQQNLSTLLPGQIRFAALKAVDRTADKTKDRLYSEMHRVFDRPTPYALGALRIKHPSMSSLVAEVGFKEPWAPRSTKFLTPQVEGGPRGLKAFEIAIQLGATVTNLRGGYSVYPKGTMFVPGPGARIDAYGNMSSGQIVQILAGLGAMRDFISNTTSRSKARKKRTGHYIATPRGVWFVDKGKMTMVLVVARSRPAYSKRFDFYGLASSFAKENFEREYEAALSERTKR